MYPTTIYRVAVKAYIVDSQNKVLVVKEKHDFWSLPGGGMEHGESPEDCLKREITEELGITDVTIGEVAYAKTMYLDRRDFWMTWIVYKAVVNTTDFILGDGVTHAQFIDIAEIESSKDVLEQSIVDVARALA